MKRDLKVVIIEDEPKDALLINAELRRGGLDVETRRVETREEFLQELEQNRPDVILSDHGLPTFDGFSALALAKERFPEVPFIFVTGSMGEDITIQTFEHGANDYVLKKNLSTNLVPAVQRALKEVEEKRKMKEAEEHRNHLMSQMEHYLERTKQLEELIPICAGCKRIRDPQGEWNDVEAYFKDKLGTSFTHGICPECAERLYPGYLR